jgi:hypothetical protein
MDTEQASSAIRSSVEAATAKYRAAPNVKKTISVVAVRNVDLPASRETFCRGIGRLLERRLVGSPNVTLLERHSLERVRRERAVSPEAPANALLASLQMVELEIARDGDDRLKATAILTTPDKKNAGQPRPPQRTRRKFWSPHSPPRCSVNSTRRFRRSSPTWPPTRSG